MRAVRHVVAALLAAVVVTPSIASAQLLSPGDLAKEHAELEGLKNCTKCHEAGKQLSEALCLDCHTELKGRVAQGKGYHGRMPAAERACQKCHLDHQGRDFEMIEWPNGKREKFPHDKTGWALEGGHAKVECNTCHEPRLIKDPEIKKLQASKRKDTHLGLSTACRACHFDEHRGQEDERCEKCHDVVKWKPAKKFDHDDTQYPLRGLHVKVECNKCHPTAVDSNTAEEVFPKFVSREYLKMKGLAHERCTDCHTDPHDGRFGRDCESCHTVDGWKKIIKRLDETEFHDKTRFPLVGAHKSVKCTACHGPLPGMKQKFKGLAFARCDDCHYDAHVGQLGALAKKGADDCSKCHDLEAFFPARYELADHAKTKYPLEGAHEVAPCRGCHPKKEELAKKIDPKLLDLIRVRKRPKLFSFAFFRVTDTDDCAKCHEDVHAGQFAERMKKAAGCTTCHVVESFEKVKLDHDKDTNYPLTGKHRDAACAGCHVPGPVGKPAKNVVVYRGVDEACASCHPDVHFAQLAGPAPTTGCDGCHTTEEFAKTKFDHQDPRFTTFALDGAHADVACEKCHVEVAVTASAKARRYKPLPRDCAGCHDDYHDGAMRRYEP